MIVLRDVATGYFFNRPSISHHGCWLPSYEQAPTFETPADAYGYMQAAGMALDGTIEPFELSANPIAEFAAEMASAQTDTTIADASFSLQPKADRRKPVTRRMF